MATWLVTGSSRGIGLAVITQLLKDPSLTVIAACRTPSKASALTALESQHPKSSLHIVELDVSNEASIRGSFDVVQRILGEKGLDYTWNNAGISEGSDTAFSLTAEALTRTLQTNVIGPALIAQTFLPLIQKSNRKVVINMSSTLASIEIGGGESLASYSISKTALNMLTNKQAQEHKDLTFLALDPGWVKTDMGTDKATLTPEKSVAGCIKVITEATFEQSGKFFQWDGKPNPW